MPEQNDPILFIIDQLSNADNPLEDRLYAIELLGCTGDERAVPSLTRALQDQELFISRHAAEVLGWIGSAYPVWDLIKLLNSEDMSVSSSANSALKKICEAEAVEQLTKMLKDEDYDVRKAAAVALSERIISPHATESLIHALGDVCFDIRIEAARALGKIGDERAVKPLVEAILNEANDSFREKLVVSLREIKGSNAVDLLLEEFPKVDPLERGDRIIKALGDLEDARAVPTLLEALGDWRVPVTSSALSSLYKLGVCALKPMLDFALQENQPQWHYGDLHGALDKVIRNILKYPYTLQRRPYVLERTIIVLPQLSPADKLATLAALGEYDRKHDRKPANISRVCRRIKRHPQYSADVQESVQAVRDLITISRTLLRGRGPAEIKNDTLLRAASDNGETGSADHLLRASQESRKTNKKRRGRMPAGLKQVFIYLALQSLDHLPDSLTIRRRSAELPASKAGCKTILVVEEAARTTTDVATGPPASKRGEGQAQTPAVITAGQPAI